MTKLINLLAIAYQSNTIFSANFCSTEAQRDMVVETK